ncbi:MAG: cytochrome c-type biogenesis protein CcmH [Pseudomonadales bacterium]|nr:cytochrome c-type biogenesis protein CcmH [Pseudomonadales bacterium]
MKGLRWGLLSLLLLASAAQATINAYTFDSPAQEQRFRQLTEELRCPRCQNESLAGSDAPIARDLKDRTYLMLRSGKSDAEIKNFMVARYGDFVIYKPPLRPRTWVLWIGPWLLLAGVVTMVISRLSRRSSPPSTLSAEEQARLDALLHKED